MNREGERVIDDIVKLIGEHPEQMGQLLTVVALKAIKDRLELMVAVGSAAAVALCLLLWAIYSKL